MIVDGGASASRDGGASRQAVLDVIRKQLEQVMRSESVNSIPPWCWLQFLPPGSCLKSLV